MTTAVVSPSLLARPHWLRRPAPISLSTRAVALLLALWCAGPLNLALWQKLSALEDFADPWALKRLALGGLIAAATFLWLMLWSWPGVRRPAWIAHLLLAASVQHFMRSYGVVMDSSMLANSLHTNWTEAWALLTPALLVQVLLLAGLPIAWLYGGVQIRQKRRGWLHSAGWLIVALAVLAGGGLRLYRDLAPLLRNHTEIRYLVNPLATVVSWANVTLKPILKPKKPFQPVTAGAALGASYAAQAAGQIKPPLLILVVGETARADHFGLNGYGRNTTPQLAQQPVLSWQQVQSCGTNTIASVPCMFSPVGKEGYEGRKVEYGNLLDIVQAAGLGVRWLDNQSGCKGVCDRVPYANIPKQKDKDPALCPGGECFDSILLKDLDARIAALPAEQRARGTVVVLHQMGSHGPAYFKRSPPAQKHFAPECRSNTLQDCPRQNLLNAYDNSIVYTDFVLNESIQWLESHAATARGALLYVSDHGESLGENNLYLHGLPYAVAPKYQKHVPWIAWHAPDFGVQTACLQARKKQSLSHDNLFHTVLGMMQVQTVLYQPALDAYSACS